MMLILYMYQKKRIIDFKNKLLSKSSLEQNVLFSQIKVQEDLMKKISEDIHDNIGLTLTLAKLKLSMINWIEPSEYLESAEKCTELISFAMDDLRALSRNMNPDIIKKMGLSTAIQEEIKRVNHAKLTDFQLDTTGDPLFLDPEKELLMYRIVQESITNILKHAKATKAWITLKYVDGWVYLTIQDNGIGIDENKISRTISSGLLNIESRCKILKGTLNKQSNSNGTLITISIPSGEILKDLNPTNNDNNSTS